jgi:hypothetical protein
LPATNTVKLIRHKQRRKGVLVPLLEDLFQRPVDIESEQDLHFIMEVLSAQLLRGETRKNRPLFSPSQLSECLRYVYLLKHHKELGIQRVANTRVEPNFYFFNGNWLHTKWQFALFKLDQALPDEIFKLIGVEVPILSKRKDHGGTVDAIVLIYGELYIIDFKGLNVRSFGEITRGTVPIPYAVQIADYGMLWNSQKKNGNGVVKISKGLLVTENKGGPTPKHLIALHETEIEVETYLPEVRGRLEVLRKHGEANSIPEPECVSTQTLQFLSCPFRKFCREEVKEIQRRREVEDRDSDGLKVARPQRSRSSSSRRNSA